VVVIDTPPSGFGYQAGTTRLNGTVVPDNTTGTAFPVDTPGLNIGSLNSGATATITFQARYSNTGTKVNQATVSSSTPDPSSTNNSSSATTVVQ
jgi:hypothetical protein